jgi:putative glycerol-1-phosphate prenyltransferase
MSSIFQKYFESGQKQLAILIDPEKQSLKALLKLSETIENSRIDLIFVGSSLSSKDYTEAISNIKSKTKKPVLLFPGNSLQLSPGADALLNLSLISGRNPEYLIGEHVKSALFVKQSGIEVIPTAYLLIESGNKTSVEYISNTQSIPRNKLDIALSTALAGEFLGLKCIYLEAGSGAQMSVPNEMLTLLRQHLNIPIICGGGMHTKKDIEDKWKAGADIVVVGTAFEKNPDLISEFKS